MNTIYKGSYWKRISGRWNTSGLGVRSRVFFMAGRIVARIIQERWIKNGLVIISHEIRRMYYLITITTTVSGRCNRFYLLCRQCLDLNRFLPLPFGSSIFIPFHPLSPHFAKSGGEVRSIPLAVTYRRPRYLLAHLQAQLRQGVQVFRQID